MPLRSLNNTLTGTSLDRWQTSCMEAAVKLGRPWSNSGKFGAFMKDAGFVDIVERRYYWATNQVLYLCITNLLLYKKSVLFLETMVLTI